MKPWYVFNCFLAVYFVFLGTGLFQTARDLEHQAQPTPALSRGEKQGRASRSNAVFSNRNSNT